MIKRIFRQLHLWLGLGSGIIVLILSLTGCIYVFQDELQDWIRRDMIKVEAIGKKQLPLSELRAKVQDHIGTDMKVSYVTIYPNPEKSWIFYSYKKNKEGITYFQTIDYYQSAYVDPYSGEIKGIVNEETNFFNVIKMLHWSLLLKTSIGQPIVGWSTFIFVFLLISGMVLWWPKSFKRAKNLFRIKWTKNYSFFRKMMDLHNVLGIYTAIIALIIALTGMVWSFKWFMGIVYVIASGSTTPPDLSQPKSKPLKEFVAGVENLTLENVRTNYPNAAAFRMYPAKDSTSCIQFYIQEKEAKYAVSHQVYYDQYSGENLKERKHEDKNTGEKLITANYDIHTGRIFGLLGKIIVFLSSLFCASLPITGFLMWRAKRKMRK